MSPIMLSKYWDKKGFDWKSILWERRSDAEPSDLVREASVNVSASLCIVGTNQHNPPHPQPLERVFDISLFGINSTQQLNSIWVSNLLIGMSIVDILAYILHTPNTSIYIDTFNPKDIELYFDTSLWQNLHHFEMHIHLHCHIWTSLSMILVTKVTR